MARNGRLLFLEDHALSWPRWIKSSEERYRGVRQQGGLGINTDGVRDDNKQQTYFPSNERAI